MAEGRASTGTLRLAYRSISLEGLEAEPVSVIRITEDTGTKERYPKIRSPSSSEEKAQRRRPREGN